MKKIMMALVIAAIAGTNAEAQQRIAYGENCGVKEDHVCKMSEDGEVSCYKTDFAENFPVCKGDYGYYICCKKPDKLNAQRPQVEGTLVKRELKPEQQEKRVYCTRGANGKMIACSYGYAGPYEYDK